MSENENSECSDSESDDACVCTFALGKSSLIHQAIYICRTCGGEDENKCCCAGCMAICHAGHDTQFLAYGRAYCDCGADNCDLSKESEVLARNVLRGSSSENIALDENGRILGTVESGLVVKPFQVFLLSNIDENDFNRLEILSRELSKYSKETFWLGRNDMPRCELEYLAKAIFEKHIFSVTGGSGSGGGHDDDDNDKRDSSSNSSSSQNNNDNKCHHDDNNDENNKNIKNTNNINNVNSINNINGYNVREAGCEWWVQVKEIEDEIDEETDEEKGENDSEREESNNINTDNDTHNNDNDNDDNSNYNKNSTNTTNNTTRLTTTTNTTTGRLIPHSTATTDNTTTHPTITTTHITTNPILTGGIDLHYDKDEEIAETFNVGIFPQLSTVTYLSNTVHSAPTIVIENTPDQLIGSLIQKCYVSTPYRGKHILFDGRFLHGAPMQLCSDCCTKKDDSSPKKDNFSARKDDFGTSNSSMKSEDDNCGIINSDERKENDGIDGDNTKNNKISLKNKKYRVTFLVNIWLNHKPASIRALCTDICDILLRKEKETNCVSTQYKNIFDNVHVKNNNKKDNKTSENDKNNDKSINLICTINIDKKIIFDESYGTWEDIPFVTEKNDWGRNKNETNLYLRIWFPSKKFFQKNLRKKNDNKIKNKNCNDIDEKKIKKSKNKFLEMKSGMSKIGINDVIENTDLDVTNCYEINYLDEESCACLIFENEEGEGEDEEEEESENEGEEDEKEGEDEGEEGVEEEAKVVAILR